MSILIRGMEMPTSCDKCPFLDYEEGFCFASGVKGKSGWYEYAFCPSGIKGGRHKNCPLVPVPPHGRLIDADVLVKRIKDEGRNQAEYYADRYAPVVMAYGDCYGKVQSAPTIIPAEGEDS